MSNGQASRVVKAARQVQPPLAGERPRIGLLTHGGGDPNNRAIWSGVVDAARELDANLICFPGKPLHSVHEFEAQSNIIYELTDAHHLDGLLIWLAGLTYSVDLDEIRGFCQRYHPMPVVIIGISLEGFPHVLVDNYHGMREVVAHLAGVHRRRRIAFIQGPENHQEARERFRAYLDVLADYGIPYDPDLVTPGNFKESGGSEAVRVFLDDRRVHFDALVGASDNMAIGAMKSLQERGIQVPADVAVAGINDELQGRYYSPPLTTAPLRFYQQARRATQMVLSLVHGEVVPQEVMLTTSLMVRQSCGCPDPLVVHAAAVDSLADDIPRFHGGRRQSTSRAERFSAQTYPLKSAGADSLGAYPEASPPEGLLTSFINDLNGRFPGDFLSFLAEALRHTAESGETLSRWHGHLSALRQMVLPELQEEELFVKAENLWHQARVMVSEYGQRSYAFQALLTAQRLRLLNEINQRLSIVTGIAELAEILAQVPRLLKIPFLCLSIYEDPELPAGWARLVVAFRENQRVSLEPGKHRFPSRQLAPADILPDDRAYSLVVEPLYFREDQLGFVLFEADPAEEETYEILRDQISGALKRAILTERNTRLYNEAVDARKVAEEADLLKSRFLSMVSHELRTPLSLIVGTIEMMLQEELAGNAPALPAYYRRDMDNIHASAQHLFRLIGDVLDLASSQAGELRLACEPLDMSQIFQEVALLGEQLAREKGLTWRAEIPEELPLVWGDRTRLRQVTLNLVSNAVKFTERGSITVLVETDKKCLRISVSDTGMGIPLEEQQAIFDEFSRSARSVQRGYGGMGLGLAISRRLIELHGGEIGVRSTGEEEAGSCFYFLLPAWEGVQSASQPRARHTNRVLLLCRRQEGVQKLWNYLERKGFRLLVLGIEDNPNWLAQVIASPPGAVVLDFQPAAEVGWELMQALKQNPVTRDIPVVFYSIFEDRDSGSVLKMDYLYKPLGSAELAQALDRMGLAAERNSSGKTILIVDDDPGILEMHVKMVSGYLPGCRILTARNGRHALQVMQQDIPDLVLLDLMMPGVDGFQVLKEMRKRALTQSVPVIVLTAQILTRQDMDRLQQGVAAVLSKGLFQVDEVMSQVAAALDCSKHLRSQVQRTVRQAMAYIHENYDEPISRGELAGYLAVTERYLTRCFREEVGITPIAYQNRYRVRQAKVLLEKGAYQSITEVALAVGFSDVNYFGRVFRQEVGVTPSAYQQGERPKDPR
jgi:signal transduction histidine kinase/DNA-binding LacI/PurR family transcriptional regulator/CheY-like chemotaxis protein